VVRYGGFGGYALELPRSGLAIILLIAALGTVALVSLWAALRRRTTRRAVTGGTRDPG
jgi:hypothetical protein